ncbi:uncharacterized protein FMAN_07327 [Fusarium mangiferae]|uniref:F-box domain-containing protein n=1 Tax=Fusarium mangiferae TaxID=192010 RepID=A0A1L7TAV1_FUSMA|nr:uncharacterized protein FMAN_07327 [Fusarium mangiferae]CVK92431.1 uncharacterized protein FMAN_07327 [Fusarium mangiferae]
MFASFVDAIGISPYFLSLSGIIIRTFSELAPEFGALTELCINGRLDFGQISLSNIETVRSLRIVDARSMNGFRQFMAAFPRLTRFSFTSTNPVSLHLDQTIWPELRFMYLGSVWITEKALSHIITTTESEEIVLELVAVTLENSTWDSFWTAMQQSGHRVTPRDGTSKFLDGSSVVIYK